MQKMKSVMGVIGVAAVAGLSTAAQAQETHRFYFAPVGNSYSAAIFGDNPIVGREVIETRIELHVRVDAGSDAFDFSTDILLPIETPTFNSVVYYTGQEQGWFGTGTFHVSEVTDRYNGFIIPARYGAETVPMFAEILEGSYIEVVFAGGGDCPADWDGSGGVDGDDIGAFFNDWQMGDADIDQSGGTDGDDIVEFFVRWQGGC